jgi:hypothetical protein
MTEIVEDVLSEDVLQIPSQQYALISVVSPKSNQCHDMHGLKIRGVFKTHEEARFHVNKLMKIDNTFDIYLVDMYKWLLIPPDNEQIENKEYQEEMLQELVEGHKKEQELAKQHHRERVLFEKDR